jgi:hypothetical protein
MPYFRKKPVEIEAVQFNGDAASAAAIRRWMAGFPLQMPNYNLNSTERLEIETLEGTMRASAGDWIIKGIHGEFYPCKPDVFEKTYDRSDS